MTTSIHTEESLRAALSTGDRPQPPGAVAACLTLCWRAARQLRHGAVEQLFDIMMMPAIFLLIFNYLFGGAIAGAPADYLQFFLPGVLVMAAVMQTTSTGTTISTDVARGVFDRFRSLPFWQPAALVGTVLLDTGRYLLALVLTAGLGLLMGFRPPAGAAGLVAAMLLVLAVAFAFAWIFTAVGLLSRRPESLQSASMVLMVVVFCSNIFVNSQTMPGWLRMIVDLNPVSHASTAARGLVDGTATVGQVGLVLLSAAVLVAVFGPLTVYLYHRKLRG
jgi:daunorubicin/doxorubicin transport system permease protein